MNTIILPQKPTEKQHLICPICGLALDVFFEMFGVPATCPDLHEPVECPNCSKDLR